MHCVIAILVRYILIYFFSKAVKFLFFVSTKDQTKLQTCKKTKDRATLRLRLIIALKIQSGK